MTTDSYAVILGKGRGTMLNKNMLAQHINALHTTRVIIRFDVDSRLSGNNALNTTDFQV